MENSYSLWFIQVQYKKNDYTVVEKTRGQPKLMDKNIQKDKTDFEKLKKRICDWQ